MAATMQSVEHWYEDARDEDLWGADPWGADLAGADLAGEDLRGLRPSTPRPLRPSRAVLRRRRVAVGGLALVALVASWIAGGAALGAGGSGPLTATGAPSGSQPAAYRSWVVRPGDTLWSIAEASGAKGDIRPLVDRLSAEVGGRPLQVGQRIALP